MRVVFIVIHYQRERFNDWKLRVVTVQMVLETLDWSTSANFEFQTSYGPKDLIHLKLNFIIRRYVCIEHGLETGLYILQSKAPCFCTVNRQSHTPLTNLFYNTIVDLKIEDGKLVCGSNCPQCHRGRREYEEGELDNSSGGVLTMSLVSYFVLVWSQGELVIE